MNIPKIVHASWHEYLQPIFQDRKMDMLTEEVFKDNFYPDKQDVFKVFKMPFDKVRVVALGQDPYSKKGQATGLAFAVGVDTMEPASLRVIRGEVARERGEDGRGVLVDPVHWNTDDWKTLNHWWHQGILLLNAALTVKAGVSGSHMATWQWFTKEVIRTISINGNRPIWLMWGSKAKGYVGYIHGYYKWNNVWKGDGYNYILEADHPAAETYPGSSYKFSGCGHFQKVNEILKHKGQSPIYW